MVESLEWRMENENLKSIKKVNESYSEKSNFQRLVFRALAAVLGKPRTMNSHPSGNFLANLSIVNSKNFDNWCKHVKVVFCYKKV